MTIHTTREFPVTPADQNEMLRLIQAINAKQDATTAAVQDVKERVIRIEATDTRSDLNLVRQEITAINARVNALESVGYVSKGTAKAANAFREWLPTILTMLAILGGVATIIAKH